MSMRGAAAASVGLALFATAPSVAAAAEPSHPSAGAAAADAVSDLLDQAAKALDAHDEAKARALVERAAATGNGDAINALAVYVEMGFGGPKDAAKARALMEQAAAAGSKAAELNLAVRLMYAADLASQKRALDLLSDVAKEPRLRSATLYPLGRMTLFGLGGLTRDTVKGSELLEQSLAGDPQNHDIQFLVARGYLTGWNGKPRDFTRAYELFHRSAEQGDERAEGWVGRMTLNGQGVGKNPMEAYSWFRKAAEHGDRISMIDVAVMLATGEGGVTQDASESRSWYLKAAERGSAHALRALGAMLVRGEGGPSDPAVGQAYLELASEAGDTTAFEFMQALGLSPAKGDRARIEQIKAEWKGAHGPSVADP